MPDIRLLDYTAKIKDLIQETRYDEAIAHCQHILRHYPKYIEAYCLLGEACLEKGSYREAIEFFQRTLSADPENFLARVGLGVIYDSQGALPEAIWQMERAFELAPGNGEVRRELQRLYSQRDGAEKSRLKLSRGALGRLYARNGLCDRAITEFRAVLHQDPDLADIRVALLETLWREGQRLEAVENCLDLLEALPNCLKANLILGEVWTRGGHEDIGQEKLDLANTLDPENLIAQELMGKDSPLLSQPVLIPELEAIPTHVEMTFTEFPPVAPVTFQEEPIPGDSAQPEEAEVPWQAAQTMPDWLVEIGLTQAEEAAADELSPDSLQGLAEAETVTPAQEPSPAGEVVPHQELPDWLRELFTEPQGSALSAAVPEPATAAEPTVEASLEVQDVEDAEAPGLEPLSALETPPSDEISEALPEVPESLKALVAAGLLDAADLEAAMAEMSTYDIETQRGEAVPDWLQELMVDEGSLPEEGRPSAPQEPPLEAVIAVQEPPEAEPATATMIVQEEILAPTQLDEAEIAVVEEEAAAAPEPGTPISEIPESLKALVAAGLLDANDLEAAMAEMTADDLQAQKAEAVPDWLQELLGEESVSTADQARIAPAQAEIRPEITDEIPTWLQDLETAETLETPETWPGEQAAPVETVAEEAAVEQAPEWLRELQEAEIPIASIEEAEPAPEEVVAAEEAVGKAPEWLRELQEAEVPETPVEEAEPLPIEPVAEEAAVEEAPEWLRELQEAEVPETPVEEAEPLPIGPVAEEAAVEEAPEWLRELQEAEVPETPIEEAEPLPIEIVAEEEAVEEAPEWLHEPKQMEVPGTPPVEEAELPIAQEVVTVLPEFVVEKPGAAPEPIIAAAEEPATPSSQLPELLKLLKAQPRDYASRLEVARLYLAEKDWISALTHYQKLISARKLLPAVIDDLQGLEEKVDRVRLYQLLGDAYMQEDRLDEALEMYRLARQSLISH